MDFENETDVDPDLEINERSKLDSLWLGLIVGIVAPIIFFVMFYYSNFTQVPFTYFIKRSLSIGALINIATICLIPDFLVFALFMWRSHYASAKGIVIASASITGLLIIGKFVIEIYLR